MAGTSMVYGPLRLPEARRKYRNAPSLPPAPDWTPRWRKDTACSSLRVNGAAPADFALAVAAARTPVRGGRLPRFGCTNRGGSVLAWDYVRDVCITRACLECPFQPDDAPAPLVKPVAP